MESIILIAAIVVIIDIVIANCFAGIADIKGCSKIRSMVLWLSFLFGPVGWIYAAALPDVYARPKSSSTTVKNKKVEATSSKISVTDEIKTYGNPQIADNKNNEESIDIDILKKADVGDEVCFGTYKQNDGEEKIEWIVLDKKDGKLFVISKYALDCAQYNTKDKKVTWESCSLRNWLNSDFYKAAFSSKEQVMIAQTTVKPDSNPKFNTEPGKITTDKLFLLSITDVEKYFCSDSERQCTPTAFARSHGAYLNESTGKCWWWLRTPGQSVFSAAEVRNGGSVYYEGLDAYEEKGAVRPAMWINLAP